MMPVEYSRIGCSERAAVAVLEVLPARPYLHEPLYAVIQEFVQNFIRSSGDSMYIPYMVT
jgi:hypothetical protein